MSCACMEAFFICLVRHNFDIAAVTNAASLIGCTVNDLILALSTCQIRAGKDKIAKSLTVEQVC